MTDFRIERVLAPNPGPFTGPGTNTWLLKFPDAGLVIDPGPISTPHLERIVLSVGAWTVNGVFVTHSHEDHAPLANLLAKELGVPAYGYKPGPGFDPDLLLVDNQVLGFGSGRVQVLYTPGHSDDHLCFLVERVLFTGDHIMGGSSVMVDDMTSYMSSLERLRHFNLDRIHPGHGPDVEEPAATIHWYIAHRMQREHEIVGAIASGAVDVDAIVEVVYHDVDRSLYPLAARSVVAHLQKLEHDGAVVLSGFRVRLIGDETPNSHEGL